MYYLTLNDETSQPLLEKLAHHLNLQQFCIYTQVSIVISKEKSDTMLAAIGGKPMIVKVSPQTDNTPYYLDRN